MTKLKDLILKFDVKSNIFRGAKSIDLGTVTFDKYDYHIDQIEGFKRHIFSNSHDSSLTLKLLDYRMAVILTKEISAEKSYNLIWTPFVYCGFKQENDEHKIQFLIKRE